MAAEASSVTDSGALLTATQMQTVDQTAIRRGAEFSRLMNAAALAVARCVASRATFEQRIVVVAGPGNNGGDGLLAADKLSQDGFQVQLVQIGRDGAKLDEPLFTDALAQLQNADIVVDALLGAGLSRAPSGVFSDLITAINASNAMVVSVDLPSGLDGNTHQVPSVAVQADVTVTFVRYKVAHWLMPGRALCGEVTLNDIGIDADCLPADADECRLNQPQYWTHGLRTPQLDQHKFSRGHVMVRGGPRYSTGAARMSAAAALQCGAGLVTLSCRKKSLFVNAAHLTAVMLACHETADSWGQALSDPRVNVALVGPGNGISELTRQLVLTALASDVSCVLDADALSAFADEPDRLLAALQAARQTPVLTPHAGEFQRVFSPVDSQRYPSRLHQARHAASLSQSVIVLKGPDTVIAAPDGKAWINVNAPPALATAGSGDVLAGILAALIAQGAEPAVAACAAVWIHGDAGNALGYPMTAEQLIPATGQSLARLLGAQD